MAEHKFLSTDGVSRLWKNVVNKVASSVDKEKQRAQQEEARLEEKIDSIVITGGSDYTEGEGIDIAVDENGQKIIKIENNSINDSHVESISFSKLSLKDGDTLILNGGNANG
jgi:uncharacterized protein YlxW (UPF0749 family)